MAIQPVGGSKVYVITGSRRDPSLTSSGQSWANLVTSQKYQLWKEAQTYAASQIKNVQLRNEYIREQKDALEKEIAQLQKQSNDWQKLEAASSQKLKEIEQRAYMSPTGTAGGRGGSTRILESDSDATIVAKRTKEARIANTQAEGNRNRILSYNKSIDKQIADLSSSPSQKVLNAQKIGELEQQKIDITPYNREVNASKSEYQRLQGLTTAQEQKDEAAKYREQRTTIQTGGTAGTAQPSAAEEQLAPNYAQKIFELEGKIAKKQAEAAALKTQAVPDYLQATRDIYTGQFGQGSPGLQSFMSKKMSNIKQGQAPQIQPPATSKLSPMSAQKRAELEALGVDEATVDSIIAQGFQQGRDTSPLYDGQKFGEAFPMESRLYPIGESGKTSDYIKPTPETPFDVRGTAPSRDLIEGNTTFEETADRYGYKGVSPYTPNFPKGPAADILRAEGRKAYEEELVRQAQLEARQNRADLEFLGAPLGDLPPAQMPNIPQTTYRSNLGEQAEQSLDVMSQELRGYQPPQSLPEFQQKREFIQNPPQFGAPLAAPSPTPSQPQTMDILLGIEKEALPEIPYSLRYKNDIITNAYTEKDKAKVDGYYKNKKNAPDYAQLVMSLYPIDKEYDQAKKDEMLQNAWDQITITYSGDQAKRKLAHQLLIEIDMLEEQKLDIQEEK